MEGWVLKNSKIRLTDFGILLNIANRSSADMKASGLFDKETAYKSA